MYKPQRTILSALLAVTLAGLFRAPASAIQAAETTITVMSLADVVADDGVCTLPEAVASANSGTASGAAFWLALASLLPGEPWGALSLLRAPAIHDAFAVAQGTLTAVAYAIYFRLLTRHGGIFASQVGYVLVLTGLAWGAAVFGEIPGLLVIPATAMIFAGLALVTSQSGQNTSSNGSDTATTITSSGKPSGQ